MQLILHEQRQAQADQRAERTRHIEAYQSAEHAPALEAAIAEGDQVIEEEVPRHRQPDRQAVIDHVLFIVLVAVDRKLARQSQEVMPEVQQDGVNHHAAQAHAGEQNELGRQQPARCLFHQQGAQVQHHTQVKFGDAALALPQRRLDLAEAGLAWRRCRDIEQDFEADTGQLGPRRQIIFPRHQEAAAHRIGQRHLKHQAGRPGRRLRAQVADTAQSRFRRADITGDADQILVALHDHLGQGADRQWIVLPIAIHDAEIAAIGDIPALDGGRGQAALIDPDMQLHIRSRFGNIEHLCGRVVGGIVVHHDDFVADAGQGIADLVHNAANGCSFIQGADNQAEIRLGSRSRSTLDIRQKRNSPAPRPSGPPAINKKPLVILRTERMANLWCPPARSSTPASGLTQTGQTNAVRTR